MVRHADITKKYKMALVKSEIHVCPFIHGKYKILYIIAMKFQRIYRRFGR